MINVKLRNPKERKEHIRRELKNDVRAYRWAILILAAWFLAMSEMGDRFWHRWLWPTTWIQAELVLLDGDERPDIFYSVTVPNSVHALWTVWAEIERAEDSDHYHWEGMGKGEAQYRSGSRSFYWAWEEFLGANPEEPDARYRLCVNYFATSSSNVTNESGPFCSNWRDPQGRLEDDEEG